jgi:leader peptidase (prepilin peptidase)/N-methyltransferase
MFTYFIISAFIFGLLVGSFLNVVILRLPHADKSIVFPASHCPRCNEPLRWYDNIPLISFVLLGGRCRYCKASISWQYPLVELTMGLLSVALFQKFYLSISFAIYFVFVAALLAVIVIDYYHQIIPDLISLPGIVLGFAVSFFNPFVTWQDSGIGILAGGGFLYAIALGYYLVTRREGMGGGDIKLLGMIGSFLGWQSLPFVVFGSSLIGAVVGIGAMIHQKKGGKTVIPYGPFLSVAAIIYLFFQSEITYLMYIYLHAVR